MISLQVLRAVIASLVPITIISYTQSCTPTGKAPALDRQAIAHAYFQEDANWYIENIPFFECSDKDIEKVYYYRWKLYKAHLRNVGPDSFVVTEFINHVPWDRDPYCTINAASMHHIYEGRWLKDDRYMNGYINNLFQDGGNDRRYSESVADAAWQRFLVNGDTAFLVSQLDSMKTVFDAWKDHYDSSKQLYYIPAMPDATEYTIASIDASGGKAGFDGGDAFRPTINSYLVANAMAISRIAVMKGDLQTSRAYRAKAEALRNNIRQNLWNDSLEHFCDRYKQDNAFVHYWNFIRGRELAGMIPWSFNVPADEAKYAAAWKHVTDTNYLLGPYGFRTNEPSYEYYFKQFVYFDGKRGSQWNGPSWPYQSSLVLTGMANLLNNYSHHAVTNSDYLRLLRLFTKQHILPDSTINLVENYDPNLGGPIVFYYWSNHYNHSSYNNLVISGLCGIRPSAGDTLTIHPLVDESIDYFFLDGVKYHGHAISVVYDRDGKRYHMGKGLSVFVDGKKSSLLSAGKDNQVLIGPTVPGIEKKWPPNFALNIAKKGYPVVSASVNALTDSLYQAVDGRIWYFTEITNQWTSDSSTTGSDWYSIDFGTDRPVSTIKLYPVANSKYALPDSVFFEYRHEGQWMPVAIKQRIPGKMLGNTVNSFHIDKVSAREWRINFVHGKRPIALSEIECY
jgi:hypothetical protein